MKARDSKTKPAGGFCFTCAPNRTFLEPFFGGLESIDRAICLIMSRNFGFNLLTSRPKVFNKARSM